jgi:two-component system, OmpR family, sensor histidine kinase TctE
MSLELPRLRTRLALAVAVPLATLMLADAWLLEHSLWALGHERLIWLLLGVLVVAWAAASLGPRALQPLLSNFEQRGTDDLSPLPAAQVQELHALVQGMNGLLAQQQQALDQQRRFLADASHQLRTPLAVLRTQLQSVGDNGAAFAALVPEMLRVVDRASGVTNELLARMKVEQRERQRDTWSALRLDEVAKEAALEFSPLMADKRLDFALDAAPLPVAADPWMLGELVRNLLANAIQHSAHGGALGIVVRRAAGCDELIVWDSGAGISDAQRERLFEPFAAATRGTGVGLGLSICRQIGEALGAEVNLFNRIDGGQLVGVDAVVRWPAAQPADADATHSPSPPRSGEPE